MTGAGRFAAACLAVGLGMTARPSPADLDGRPLDLGDAVIVVPAGGGRDAERLVASVLQEEIEQRSGIRWEIAERWPDDGRAVVAIAAGPVAGWPALPSHIEDRPEAYLLERGARGGSPVIWLAARGRRPALFAAGRLLRALDWRPGSVRLDRALDVSTAPRYALRGHQLGYRHHSNTYDGWNEAQYERYIRELVLLGANAIENIPFQDRRASALMPLPRAEMVRRVSAICAKYDLEYWLWMPAEVDLADAGARRGALEAFTGLAATLPRLDAVFVPGGDPGDNAAPEVMPWLEALSRAARRRHPAATVWLSLQHFDREEVDFVFHWIESQQPDWLGGLVGGPSSYPLEDTRRRLPPRYRLRDYPDIGHTVRSQYPVSWWDPAFALTLGREPVNPRGRFYAGVHDRVARFTDGFITYSDGVNDDFNKAVWTLKGWDPSLDATAIAREYARLFFGADAVSAAVEGLLGLERNWDGPLAANTSVARTLAAWEAGQAHVPWLADNWRWQLHLMRATYDAYTRKRQQYEASLEEEAIDVLAQAGTTGALAAMRQASTVLDRASRENCCPRWRARIESLCQTLFETIRLQTSVATHSASGFERGAVLDFVDHPLNNRWHLQDRFAAIAALGGEASRQSAIATLVAWTRPGAGSFYDDVGNVAGAPRVSRPSNGLGATPHFTWEGGPSRSRLSSLTSQRWPAAIEYTGLDTTAGYVVRLHVMRPGLPPQVRLRIDGLTATTPRRVEDGTLDFAVAPALVQDGRLTLTFDDVDESDVNWRQHSRLTDAWLLRQ